MAINLDVVYSEIVNLKEIKPATYISRGVIERLKSIVNDKNVELLVADCKLSPVQQRNLEKELNIKVIDRTALILEIFGERAQTMEGTLQVELAHLTYQRSRLVRSWTHLERQRGGAGFLGGPGEKQVEIDRRIIDEKIVRIKKELEKVKKTRQIQRGARQKIPYPVVALVGYTNAGKSSLFNYLTQSSVMAENMLFATLDPTMRKLTLKGGIPVILSDTVGFISDLPHELIMAFRATLEEVLNADVILHVRDVSNQDNKIQRDDVLQVLHNLGLQEIEDAENYIEVYNKSDLLDKESFAYWQNKTSGSQNKVMVSALNGNGCENLLNLIKQKLSSGSENLKISLPVSDGALTAWIYRNSDVKKVTTNDDVLVIEMGIKTDKSAKLMKIIAEKENVSIENC
ncbi:MAG: GTPase HflX [Alphaproteobacteria bacterium]|nr:GTPase HflX [Alphaproteobacteria bacterium]